jgi:hypothetical protein
MLTILLRMQKRRLRSQVDAEEAEPLEFDALMQSGEE